MPSRPKPAPRAAASAAFSLPAPDAAPLVTAKAEAAKRLFNALDTACLPADAVEVGGIGEAWGIKGGFKVHALSPDPEALFSSKRWLIQPKIARPTDAVQTWVLRIAQAKEHGEGIVATSPDVADRTSAEVLKGAKIFVPRSSFPTLPDGEFYWVDLLGLAVINREGVALGTVSDLLSTGPQTVLVLTDATTEPATERLIPFVNAFVDTVDIAAKRITVDWQPDY